MPTTAVLYARRSHDPDMRGRSIDDQLAELRADAVRHGWDVAAEVVDRHRSASRKATRAREGWLDVERRLEAGGVDVLAVWEVSRASRDVEATARLMNDCERLGVSLAFGGRLYDPANTDDRQSLHLGALVAEGESNRISDRGRRTKARLAAEGRPAGRLPFGYRREYDPATGRLVRQIPDETEAPAVREMFARFAAGESMRAIYRDYEARGVTGPNGRAWDVTSTRRALTKPAYVGLREHRGEVVGAADWPPLVDRSTWDVVQARLETDYARYRSHGPRPTAHLLTGIARCGECGAPMSRYVNRKASGATRPALYCKAGGGHVVRSEAPVEALVVETLRARLDNDEHLAAVLDGLDDTTETSTARAEAATLTARLDDAAAAFARGELSAVMLAKVETELRPQIDAANRAARATGDAALLAPFAEAGGFSAAWDAATVDQRREVVRLCVEVVVLPSSRPRGSRGFKADDVRIAWLV